MNNHSSDFDLQDPTFQKEVNITVQVTTMTIMTQKMISWCSIY